MTAQRFAFILLLLAAAGPRLLAQGGPPMFTDDPGTPGANHWEFNFGWTTQRTPGAELDAVPQMDLNYGVGDRIEVTYFSNVWYLRQAGESAQWGLDDSQLSVKWRFYDAGDGGLQISVYPQMNFPTPGTSSERRGLAAPTNYALPFEFERDFKWLSVDVDCGHVFATGRVEDGWWAGLCLGREVKKGWELDTEVHVQTDAAAGRGEVIYDGATRIDLSENVTLMLLLGRDVANGIGPEASLLSYAGIQLRL